MTIVCIFSKTVCYGKFTFLHKHFCTESNALLIIITALMKSVYGQSAYIVKFYKTVWTVRTVLPFACFGPFLWDTVFLKCLWNWRKKKTACHYAGSNQSLVILTGLKNLSDPKEKVKMLFYALVGNLVFIYSHLRESENWSNERVTTTKKKEFKATGSKWPNLKLSAVYVTSVITSFF